LIHKIIGLYKTIYQLGKQISKRDRLGLIHRIEDICLDALMLAIEAAYSSKQEKPPLLKRQRIKIETIKQLVRLTADLEITDNRRYLGLAKQLIEISKMNNNWLNWSTKESPGRTLLN